MTSKERLIFEKGFEEGYRIAKRLYKAHFVTITTKDGTPIKKKIK